VLEAMAYHSQQLVTPAYYEKTLKGRDIRDEESGEMLDIIFATHSYDLGLYYQIGSYNANLVTMVRAGINRFASIYQSTARQAESVITQLNEQYSAID